MTRREVKKSQASRSITYRIDVGYDEGEFSEAIVEPILEKAVRDGLVLVFDTGRGHLVWFTGAPGSRLRALKKEVQAAVDATYRPYLPRKP